MLCRPTKRSGVTLVELLIVVSLIAILASAMLPSTSAGVPQQLVSAARIVARDMAYCRSLAVSYNDEYRVQFDFANNKYAIEHSGSNSALDALPPSAFRSPGDPPNRHIVRFSDIPNIGVEIQLTSVLSGSGSPSPVAELEYGPLGQLEPSDKSVTIWLAAGAVNNMRYISVRVDKITGIAKIGKVQTTRPQAA